MAVSWGSGQHFAASLLLLPFFFPAVLEPLSFYSVQSRAEMPGDAETTSRLSGQKTKAGESRAKRLKWDTDGTGSDHTVISPEILVR